MRPDPYKQKKSRRYQLTHKDKLANAKNTDNKDKILKEKENPTKDKTNNVDDTNDNNNNDNNNNKIRTSYNKKANKNYEYEETGKSYGRRKIIDNSYRYEEPTYEDQLEAEAEIDVAVEDALSLINSQENATVYDPSSYFQFKKENWLNSEEFEEKNNTSQQEIFNLDFNKLDKAFKTIPIWDRIKINKDFIINEDNNININNSDNNIPKIVPIYNYIGNNSVNLNNKYNFNISKAKENSVDNVKETTIENNKNDKNDKNDKNIKNDTISTKKENIEKIIEPSKPKSNNIDFDIDELLNDAKPAKTGNKEKEKESAIEDELNMLLSFNGDKTNSNNNSNNDNTEILNSLNSLNNNSTSKNTPPKNNQNMDNLQDWLDDLLS